MVVISMSVLPFRSETVDQTVCCYCGRPYDLQRDHVIPTSYLREKRKFEGDWLVPACGECNSTLGAEPLFNIPDRAAWLSLVYRKKYAKLLRAPVWSEADYEDVSTRFRYEIEARQRLRAEAIQRVRHLDTVAAMPVSYLTSVRPFIDDFEEVSEFGEAPPSFEDRRKRLFELARWRKRVSKNTVDSADCAILEKQQQRRQPEEPQKHPRWREVSRIVRDGVTLRKLERC